MTDGIPAFSVRDVIFTLACLVGFKLRDSDLETVHALVIYQLCCVQLLVETSALSSDLCLRAYKVPGG